MNTEPLTGLRLAGFWSVLLATSVLLEIACLRLILLVLEFLT